MVTELLIVRFYDNILKEEKTMKIDFEYRYNVSKRLSIVFSKWQRLDYDRTQEVFANEVGVARNALSRWLSGKTVPNAEQVHQICLLCHCSADWLLGLSNENE